MTITFITFRKTKDKLFICGKRELYCVIMTVRTTMRQAVQVEFREVNTTGVFLAHTEANRKTSVALLKQNGFRALTYQEALVKIDQNPELKEQLKGKWFYLDGKGSALSGYYTFDERGDLTKGQSDIEKTVYVWKGNQTLSLDVRADDYARIYEGRFYLNASFSPDYAARVVVGVKDAHEVGTPKIEVAPAEEGIKLTGVTTKQLTALLRGSAQELSNVEAFGTDSLPQTRMLVEALRIKE